MTYAGFWLRLVAIIIDGIILGIAGWVIIGPILAAMGIASGLSFGDLSDPTDVAALVATLTAMFGVSWFIKQAIDILYHSFMESSKYQGSIGKLALGLIVVDLNGQKLDFSKAFIRNICKLISGFIFCIGYIIAGFTEKKQALHDIIAGTLVIKKVADTPGTI
jgi:uncharacterized RDD family membrane protein YckC